MGVNTVKNKVAYGLDSPLQPLAAQPIISGRNPTANDTAELGTIWVNRATDAYFVLTSVVAGSAVWTAQATGSGTFASVEITGGAGTVLTVDAGGDTELGGNLDVAGNSVFAGDLTVDGDATFNGDLDITSTDAISFTSTSNTNPAILLHADGGALEAIELHSDQGTSLGSVYIHSDVGGILINSVGKVDNAAVNLVSDFGGIQFDSVLTSAWNVVGAGQDIQINATGGSIAMTATEDAVGAITIEASGATDGSVNILAGGGLGLINMVSQGGTHLEAVGAAMEFVSANNTVTLTSGTGDINISADATATAVNLGTGAGVKTVTIGSSNTTSSTVINSGSNGIELVSGTGSIQISSDNTATSVFVGAGAGAKTVLIGSATTTSSTTIRSGTGDVIVTSTDDITLDAATGLISIDSTETSNFTVTGAGADLNLTSVGGSVLVEATEDAALAIRLHANGGTSETIQIHSDQGTGVGSIGLLSDVGGLTLRSTGLASADAINLEAAAGGIDVDAALQINVASSQDAVDAIRIVATGAITGGIDIDASLGGVTVDSTGTVSIDGVAASNFTLSGAGADLTLLSSAGSVILQGGEAVNNAVQLNASNAAGGIDVLAGTGGISLETVGAGNIVLLAGSTSNGTVTITSTGTGDILLDSDDTLLLDSDGVLELNSSAGAISVGNDAVNQAINVGTAGQRTILIGNATAGTTVKVNGPANVGLTLQNDLRIMTGAGSPNGAVTAPAGSLWLRTDPAGATSRIYVNTDSGTTWTNVTCAA